MNTIVDIRSTPECAPRQAFEQWECLLSGSYFPMTLIKPQLERFHGRIRAVTCDTVAVSSVEATPHGTRRSRRHIDQPDDPSLLLGFPTAGRGWLDESGRVTAMEPGGLVIYDSVHPTDSHFYEGTWGITTAMAPLSSVVERSGVSIGRLPINVRIPTTGAFGVIEQFFRDLLEVQQTDSAAAVLGAHALDLMASAVLLACDSRLTEQSAQALARQQVLAFVRSHYTAPDLTTEQIARACAVSRRTLYRLFEDVEGGVAAMVRRRRIGTARALLRTDRTRSLESIAAASGFASDRHFYRVFKQQTGMTPGEYRALQHPADRPHA